MADLFLFFFPALNQTSKIAKINAHLEVAFHQGHIQMIKLSQNTDLVLRAITAEYPHELNLEPPLAHVKVDLRMLCFMKADRRGSA